MPCVTSSTPNIEHLSPVSSFPPTRCVGGYPMPRVGPNHTNPKTFQQKLNEAYLQRVGVTDLLPHI